MPSILLLPNPVWSVPTGMTENIFIPLKQRMTRQYGSTLDIFEGVLNIEADGFEWVDKGRFRYHLYKQDVDNIVPGHWPEASTMILTRGYLDPYPSAVLRYMRNEIYARKGYKFENESLASFFCQNGNWYHPSDSQEKVPLSLVEELNIQLIQSIERERKNKKTSQN